MNSEPDGGRDATQRTYTLFDADGEICVRGIEATPSEIATAIEAADREHPQNAPHYAHLADDEPNAATDDGTDDVQCDYCGDAIEDPTEDHRDDRGNWRCHNCQYKALLGIELDSTQGGDGSDA